MPPVALQECQDQKDETDMDIQRRVIAATRRSPDRGLDWWRDVSNVGDGDGKCGIPQASVRQ